MEDNLKEITMKKSHLWAGLALTAAFLLSPNSSRAQNNADFAIKDGDRVVFYGDSITDSRYYTTFAETYIVTRFPQKQVSFVHSGWGGDRVTGGGGGPIDVRLNRDVLAYKPSVVTIMLGMNDGSYRAFDQGIFDTYSKGYKHIVDVLKQGAPGVRITAIQPSPYDDVTRPPAFEGGYNGVLIKYSEFVHQLAQQEQLGVADLNTPVVAMLKQAQATNPDLSQKLIPDRVHPNPAGHLVMAEALLKSWNAPALVTSVEISAAPLRVAKADNTQVTGLQGGDTLSWTQNDGALPFPIDTKDPQVALVVNSSDIVQALDQQPLKVTGLPATNYQLKIDGTAVGVFSKEELAAGLNLATLPTPMVQQALAVHALTWRRSNAHNSRWRSIQVPLEADTFPAVQTATKAALPALLDALDAEDADLAKQQRAAAQPVPHKYELSPQP